MGMLPSQLCGVFHGRTESFSGSVVSQPLTPTSRAPSKRSSSHLAAGRFTSGSRMGGTDFIPFDHLAQFPTGDDVGDAAVLFHAADYDLGHEPSIAADQ